MESEKPVIDFARVRTDRTCVIGVGWPAGARRGCHRPDPARRRSRPMTELHRRLRTINIAGSGAPKTAGGGYVGARPGKCSGHRPPDDGPGNHRPPPRQTPLDSRSTSQADWARETVGSGRVSGAVTHVSEHAGNATGGCDRRPDSGMGDYRPGVT